MEDEEEEEQKGQEEDEEEGEREEEKDSHREEDGLIDLRMAKKKSEKDCTIQQDTKRTLQEHHMLSLTRFHVRNICPFESKPFRIASHMICSELELQPTEIATHVASYYAT